MHAGRLDRRIVIQSYTEARDSFGEPIKIYSTLATVWAQKLETPGKEQFQQDRLDAVQPVEWRIRYRGDVTPKMRVSYASQLYDISAVRELGRKEGLILTSVAQVP